MGEGGRGGPRLAFRHRSREKRNRGSSLSYISPPSYPREHYPTIDHTRSLQRKSVVESHAHTFRTSSSGISFRTGVARRRSLRPKMSGEIVGGGNRGFYESYCFRIIAMRAVRNWLWYYIYIGDSLPHNNKPVTHRNTYIFISNRNSNFVGVYRRGGFYFFKRREEVRRDAFNLEQN